MCWATYRSRIDERDHVGLVEADELVYGLPEPMTVLELLGGRREYLSEAARRERSRPFEVLGQKDVHWRAPIPIPPSVRDFMAFGATPVVAGVDKPFHMRSRT